MTTENHRHREPVTVIHPSDAYIELRPSEDGGAIGHLILTYVDETPRNFFPVHLPNGIYLQPQGIRSVWCGARPDCGIREERFSISMTREAVSTSAQDGLTLVLYTSDADRRPIPWMGNSGRFRQERIVLPAHQMRHALRRGHIRY